MADDDTTTPQPDPTGGDAPAPEDVVPASTDPTAPDPSAPGYAAPTPPPPAPPGGFAPAPPARTKRRWLPVFLVLMGVIVLIIVAGGVLFVTRTLPPYQAANDFVDDLADNKFQAAADQLCAADQDDPDAAISTVTRNFVGRDNVAVNPFGVDRSGDTATVDYTVSNDDTPDNADDSKTYELRVVNEDGDWKPCPNASAR